MPDCIFTSVDVENQIGIHRKKVGNALWHYKQVGVPYFRRPFLARLRRKTKCCTKSIEMLKYSVFLLVKYRNNKLTIVS